MLHQKSMLHQYILFYFGVPSTKTEILLGSLSFGKANCRRLTRVSTSGTMIGNYLRYIIIEADRIGFLKNLQLYSNFVLYIFKCVSSFLALTTHRKSCIKSPLLLFSKKLIHYFLITEILFLIKIMRKKTILIEGAATLLELAIYLDLTQLIQIACYITRKLLLHFTFALQCLWLRRTDVFYILGKGRYLTFLFLYWFAALSIFLRKT